MGKHNIMKFLAVLPFTATLLVNTNVYTNDGSQATGNNNLASTYEVPKDLSQMAVPQLALRNDLENLKVKVKDEFPESKMRIEDNLFDSSELKAIKVIKSKGSSKKGDKVKVKDETLNENPNKDKFEDMTDGFPISQMMPYILERDPKTAAFIVAIAKKESNWGRKAPHHDGKDCFNYWGFKDGRFETVLGGHSCFPSPEKAVEAVGNRIEKLVNKGFDTPSEFVIWKCGSACKSDGNASKWISDVGMYYNKLAYAPNGK